MSKTWNCHEIIKITIEEYWYQSVLSYKKPFIWILKINIDFFIILYFVNWVHFSENSSPEAGMRILRIYLNNNNIMF